MSVYGQEGPTLLSGPLLTEELAEIALSPVCPQSGLWLLLS